MALEEGLCMCVHARACACVHHRGREVGDIACLLKTLHQAWKHPFTFRYSVDLILVGPCGTGQKFRKVLCCLCGTDNTRPRIITCIQDDGTIKNLSVEAAFAAGAI